MSRALHIAYVCADGGVPIGGRKGASTHVGELTRALVQRGAAVRILAARTAGAIAANHPSAPVIDLGTQTASRMMRQAVFAAAATRRQQAQAAEAYGLLLNQVLFTALERLHRRWRIEAVYERYSLWSYAGVCFAREARIPLLLEVNAPLREEQRRYRSLDNAAAAASLESYVLRMADYVLVPSAALRAYVVERGVRPGAVRVVPNAAEPALFRRGATVRAPRRRGGEFVVGFLGTLKPWHGVEDLVRAFHRLRRRCSVYRLLIAGDGPLRPALERELRRYRLSDAVTFSGEIDHDQVPLLLARMHVAVAPYPRLAGFYFSPLKLFEYMAAGLPVVASDIGQIGEILVHRKTALLHRPGAIAEMVAHIEELRRHPALAARLAREARRLVRNRFTWRRNADRVLAMITALRRRRHRRLDRLRRPPAAERRHASR
jgi:glycosyltransferase involved in cell wall biosynthesis